MATPSHWTQVLSLRPEVTSSEGGVGELQMSLHKAVYQTVDVPYREVPYYAEITQPTPNLVGFFARIARRVGASGETVALFHLDQGMGGGKSHALVGLFHMASAPKAFFGTDLGKAIQAEAEAGGARIDLTGTQVVTLCADHFSPGKPTENFGPATSLFERFLWGLFSGDRKRYDRFVNMGANKGTIQEALVECGRPVLILLDELMDYVMSLSDASTVVGMPGEQVFLNSLMDACDDVPRVAFVVVMIRSELDPEGYPPVAQGFRDYIAQRLTRNGTTVAVTEPGDFASIIRRRLFERPVGRLPARQLADGFRATVTADSSWNDKVLDKLGPGRGLAALADRIEESYPFHPNLMNLVQEEWAKVQGFQRVRSTVAIFATTALYWVRRAAKGEWVPQLIGVGDIPLTMALEAVLSSGLLLGNDRAIQGYRAVATTDISSADGSSGKAVAIDRQLTEGKVDAGQPNPAVRMATALFCYSLVARSQGRRGATKAELMEALLLPAVGNASPFSAVEEVFWALTGDEGLGALEVIRSANQPERFWLTIKQTLRMFYNSCRASVTETQKLDVVWETAQDLAKKGQFEELHFVNKPKQSQTLADVAGHIDSQSSRLVVLDPREWTLLNGTDEKSREAVRRLLGLGPGGLTVDNGASCVLACVNTYRRRRAIQAAEAALTWTAVLAQLVEAEERSEAERQLLEAEKKLKVEVAAAFQHYAYLIRHGEQLDVEFKRFDDDTHSSLFGDNVWSALVDAGRAVGEYFDPAEKRRKRKPLGETYLAALLGSFDRHLTLKDVTSSFYKNPSFPLVPSVDEIRSAIFELLQPGGHAGEGTGGWELVDGAGQVLAPANPGQLAINSIQQQLRQAQVESAIGGEVDGGDAEAGTEKAKGEGEAPDSTQPESEPTSYSWYRLDLINRSIASEDRREAVRKLLVWLASKLDEDGLDHQLVTLKFELNAATDEVLAAELEDRADAVEAKSSYEEESS